jgi:hypothetical protein
MMHIRPTHLTVVGVAALLIPASGLAQSEHVWISGNVVAAIPATDDFTQPLAFPYRSESLTGSLAYPLSSQASFDIGAGLLVRRHFGLGLAVTHLSTADAAAVAISVPDAYRFNAYASANGVTATPLSHNETTLHVEAAYLLTTRTAMLRLFAGPSIFHTTQDVITDVQYSETATDPGVHSIALTGESYGRVIETTVGFNVGADGGMFITRHIGVGAILRVSHGSASIKNVPQSAGQRIEVSQDVRVGGLAVGGGVRLRF